jgi:hypothetical protein
VERRAAADAQAVAAIDALRRASAMKRHEAALSALARIMIRGRAFVLDTIAALGLDHVWVCDGDDLLIGHVLTVPDDVLTDAAGADRLDVLTLDAAMRSTWADAAARKAWRAAYIDALRALAREQERMEQSEDDRVLLRRAAGLDDE